MDVLLLLAFGCIGLAILGAAIAGYWGRGPPEGMVA